MLQEVPLIAIGLGAIAGAPAALMAGCHFSVMVKDISQVFAAGPPVVKRSVGMDIHKEDLGGYKIHARGSGLVDNEAEDEPLRLDGLHRFVRHPLYAAGLLILWGRIGGPFELATAVWGTLYIVIGTAMEERRLARLYGADYTAYRQRVPAYVPWKGRAPY